MVDSGLHIAHGVTNTRRIKQGSKCVQRDLVLKGDVECDWLKRLFGWRSGNFHKRRLVAFNGKDQSLSVSSGLWRYPYTLDILHNFVQLV